MKAAKAKRYTNANKALSVCVSEYLARGHSQSELGNELGINQVTVSQKVMNKRRWTIQEFQHLFQIGAISPVDLFRIMKGSADE